MWNFNFASRKNFRRYACLDWCLFCNADCIRMCFLGAAGILAISIKKLLLNQTFVRLLPLFSLFSLPISKSPSLPFDASFFIGKKLKFNDY
jgi:hypothetical protein